MDEQYENYANAIRMGYMATGVPVIYPEPIFKEEQLSMADGAPLYTYFYFPAGEGSFPVVVQRHPYAHLGMDFVCRITGEEFAKRGYIYVCQHCRGTGKSGGEWEPNANERKDGLALFNWLSAQPWCGNIGIMGESYLALVGWSVADAAPEKVKSMYLCNYGVDRFTSLYQDGLIRHDIMTGWAMENAGTPISADYLESCRYRPHEKVDEELWGVSLPWYREYLQSADRNSQLWREGLWNQFSHIPENCRIPLFIGDNWYDHHLGSALYSYEHLNVESRFHSVLRIGGLDHFGAPCLEDRETHRVMVDSCKEQLDWFDQTLRQEGLPNRSIRTYVINRDIWREWECWPLPQSETLRYAFSAERNGAAYKLKKDGEQVVDAASVSFIYDPEEPVPSHGAESMLTTKPAIGSLRQPEPGYRTDVISFVSEPLEKEAEITGQIKLRLFVSTDAEDTSFTAKVMEVLPDGRAYNIRSKIAVVSYQNKDYKPGQIVPLEMEMWDIDWMLSAGSRLRVDISSSDFPQYAVHPNLAGPWYRQTESRRAVQKVWCGGHPSTLEIPIFRETREEK